LTASAAMEFLGINIFGLSAKGASIGNVVLMIVFN
jgi:hypothetical protein